MQTRELILALVFGCSLLLAPRAVAQQELIDPQPEPGAESHPLPGSPAAPAPTPHQKEQAPPTTEAPAQPARVSARRTRAACLTSASAVTWINGVAPAFGAQLASSSRA